MFCPPGFTPLSYDNNDYLQFCQEGTCGYWLVNDRRRGSGVGYISYWSGAELYELLVDIDKMNSIGTQEELDKYLETQYAISLVGGKTFGPWRDMYET